MNIESIPLWLALFLQLGLGLAVFRANPRSYVNQSFLLVSVILSAWLVSLHFALGATQAGAAAFWIRNASASGLFMAIGFNLLRLAILCREGGWRDIWRRSAVLALSSLIAGAICYTPLFLRYAEIRNGEIPRPVYGPLFPFYVSFCAIVGLAVLGLYLRDLRQTSGMQKVEIQFVVAGCGILAGLLVFMPVFVHRDIAVQFAPFRVVIFSLIIAYGVSTRKIMEVGFFFRRMTSYAVLTAYLLAIYIAVWWLVFTAFHSSFPYESRTIAHVAAALVLAFAMAPARGVSQSLANRLFVGTRGIDFQSTMSQAAGILKSVSTLQDLLDRFAKTIGEAVGTDRVFIFLLEKEFYAQHYPAVSADGDSPSLHLSRDDPMISYLQTNQDVLVLDELHRVRKTP